MAAGRSEAERAKLELGRRIAALLTPIRTRESIADELGISRQAVESIEQRALAKVAIKMRELYGANH